MCVVGISQVKGVKCDVKEGYLFVRVGIVQQRCAGWRVCKRNKGSGRGIVLASRCCKHIERSTWEEAEEDVFHELLLMSILFVCVYISGF